ncbi:MAG: ribose-5-phosphate isomerase RpiA [Candidatus Micrarchaeota archaeon]|nr:ribose-5-phosphate isomerase RpiA [Candidatus Micrarchaeota archaeon]
MDASKLAAAKKALEFVKPGMNVGLGTGSTSEIFIELLGQKNRRQRLNLTCIATSNASAYKAKRLGLRLSDFSRISRLDIAFDGADQVDSDLNLLKGLGGALVREKIVDYRADRFVVMVGQNKLVRRLYGVVPVEVIPMAEDAVKQDLVRLGARGFETRMDGRRKFVSDNSNLILHAEFGQIANPRRLEDRLNGIAGVVDNGIFSKKKPIVVVGHPDGTARIIR